MNAEKPTRAKDVTRNERIIWAAGFLDGEGFIGTSRGVTKRTGQPFHTAHIGAAQIRRKPLDVLAELFGGTVHPGQRAYYWRVNSQDARRVCEALLPYLVGKCRQAELVIDFCIRLRGAQGRKVSAALLQERELLHQELRTLNQTGVYVQAERLSESDPQSNLRAMR